MLLTFLSQERPDALYVAWDAPGKTFREEKFVEYKAHRPEATDDLRVQFPIARRLVEAFGIPAVEKEGYEADDVIGTLAEQARRQGYEVTILTGDSDQLQLIRDGITVRMTRTGVTDTELYDAEKVAARYGVRPEQIADLKALMGDASDNIPGVPGIGKVTATKLLQEWGSLENLLAHVDELPEGNAREHKIKESLKNNLEVAKLSLELATIRRDVPLEVTIQPYRPTPQNWAQVREIFAELEFRKLAQRLEEIIPESAGESLTSLETEPRAITFLRITNPKQLRSALEEVRTAGQIALRAHADSWDPMRATLLGLAFAATADRSYYLPIQKKDSLFGEPSIVSPEELWDVLQEEKIERIGHNLKFEAVVLGRRGIPLGPLTFDTMIAAYLLQPGRTSYPLQSLIKENLKFSPADDSVATEERLACEAALLLALREPMQRRIVEATLADVMYRIEMPLVEILAAMEQVGVPVDRQWLDHLSEEMGQKIDQVAQRIYELAGEEFLISSTQQLQRILFEKLKLPTGKKTKTGFSTSADLLESLATEHEIAARVLEYRELTKLKSTYADALPRLIHPETGRIHTSLNQTVAATGRLSSSEPNLQNIPIRSEAGRQIRKAFIAPPGQVLLSCDYSQIELRVLAHITKDPALTEAFAANEDIHAATATRLFNVSLEEVTPEMRRRAKTANFAIIYGQTGFGLANSLGISREEAQEFIRTYFAQFPGVRTYIEQTIAAAREQGWVQTLLGRRRYLPEIHSGNRNVREAAERAAINMPIQGTSADIMKLAMIDVYRYLRRSGAPCTLLLQVHDELVFGIQETALLEIGREIVHLMENAYKLDVPIRVDAKLGPNWAEMQPLSIIHG